MRYITIVNGLLTAGALVLLPAAIAAHWERKDFGIMFTLDVNVYLISIGQFTYWLIKYVKS